MKQPEEVGKQPEQDITASDLEAFFAAARATPPSPSHDLQARIMADATAELPRAMPRGQRLRRRLTLLWQGLGGAPALGGLATATCVGVWLGLAPPAGLPDIAGQIFTDTETVLADSDDILPELNVFGWDSGEG